MWLLQDQLDQKPKYPQLFLFPDFAGPVRWPIIPNTAPTHKLSCYCSFATLYPEDLTVPYRCGGINLGVWGTGYTYMVHHGLLGDSQSLYSASCITFKVVSRVLIPK